ncbi:MAG TPA: tol-pal system protein YbgF [Pseudolabrys sp.]|nr:tol-pal system protein YbgF [Pseudolabrys sp.]
MTRTRRLALVPSLSVAALAAALVFPPAPVSAQQNGNFLDNLFNRGDSQRAPQEAPGAQGMQQGDMSSPRGAPGNDSEMGSRLDRIENALRQLTGTIEQLQYRNQQLEMQLKRVQDDTEYRFQQLGVRGNAPSAAPSAGPSMNAPMNGPMNAPMGAPPVANAPGRRSDVFDPSQHPNAPGAPRTLGNEAAIMAPEPNSQPIGAPGGREAGAPLDLTSLAGSGTAMPPPAAAPQPMAPQSMQPPIQQRPMQQPVMQQPSPAQLPGPPPRNVSATGAQLATLPPSARPQDEYDMAYGYVLHKDYGLAEQAFRDFLRKHPQERLVPDAQYWLGESLYQQQRYRDAAESFLAVSTKYEHSGKAPESLLRLGQSLAGLNKKEAACATLAEVGRKYPRASASVKRSVAQEQKRVHC